MRLACAAALSVLLAVLLAGVDAGAQPAPFAYVALGDSFSSGEGVAPYLQNEAQEATRCDRSTRAYATWVRPPGLAASVYSLTSGGGTAGADNRYGSDENVRTTPPYAWAFWACSGAKTKNVLPSSQGGIPQGAAWATEPQLDSAAASLTDANLVTLTIGGNDAGYVDVLVQCGLFKCNTAAFRRQRAATIDATKPLLEKLYAAVAAAAPRARILVLGYAQPFPATKREQSCVALRAFAGEQDMLRTLGVRLNGTIAAAVAEVAKSGAHISFVPVAPRWAGHEVCGRKGAWMSGILTSKAGFGLDPGSFHPNLKGQRDGYAAAVNAALR
jgi:lysophospholipase L1-like esterase